MKMDDKLWNKHKIKVKDLIMIYKQRIEVLYHELKEMEKIETQEGKKAS